MTKYELMQIDKQLEVKQTQLVKLAKTGKDYEDIADEVDTLREQRKAILIRDDTPEYDEGLVRRTVEKVTIYEDKLSVTFKSGIEISN